MRVFVAGATGAIGRQLIPQLLTAGHEVRAMTRTARGVDAVRTMGADATIADALDIAAVAAAVGTFAPEIVVHELTAIPARVDPRSFAEDFRPTNRLRREGTRNLVSAAITAGARRFVTQSIAQAYRPVGSWVKVEDDPLYDEAPPVFREIFDSVIEMEGTVLGGNPLEAVVFRYGNFYGPGTRFASDGSDASLVRDGRFPIAGDGCAHWSFIHVHDAAAATVRAVDDGPPGVYNIVDDEPAPVSEWLPAFAEALDAPPPPRVAPPTNDYAAFGMLAARGASNAKARARLDWSPRYASWRSGFALSLD